MKASRAIDPGSLRGRLAVRIHGALAAARAHPGIVRAAADAQGLTEDQQLAAVITEAVLGELRKGFGRD